VNLIRSSIYYYYTITSILHRNSNSINNISQPSQWYFRLDVEFPCEYLDEVADFVDVLDERISHFHELCPLDLLESQQGGFYAGSGGGGEGGSYRFNILTLTFEKEIQIIIFERQTERLTST
jgi:hypothetical protein